jgi:hypothetical protein
MEQSEAEMNGLRPKIPPCLMLIAIGDSHGFIAAASMKRAGNVSDMEARAMVTV